MAKLKQPKLTPEEAGFLEDKFLEYFLQERSKMTVKELIKKLKEYGDHVEVRVRDADTGKDIEPVVEDLIGSEGYILIN